MPTKGEVAALAVMGWCAADGLPVPVAEFRFHATRKFQFDLCWEAEKLALEFQGGTWTGGRHTRGKGYENDAEKFSLAAVAGYRVILATYKHVEDGTLRIWLRDALGGG